VLAVLCFAATTAIAQAEESTRPTTPPEWRAQTVKDLAAIRALLSEHSPIPLDRENAATALWLDEGFAAAEARIAKVATQTDWYYTLAAYTNGFRDPHVSVSPSADLPPVEWPGFFVAARGADAVVVGVDATDRTLPPDGARITQCDGKPVKALVNEHVFPFVLNPSLPADQRRAVSRLFIQRPNNLIDSIRTCEVATAEGTRTIALQWRAVPSAKDSNAAWWQRYAALNSGPTPPFGLATPAPGVTWISVPTFNSGSDTAPKLEQLIRDVEAKGEAMRQGRAIIIDTRGNGGGNSAWASKLAHAIFTPTVVKRFAQEGINPRGVDWRASDGNIAYWQEWETKMEKEFGAFSSSRLFAQHVARQMSAAREAGEAFYREGTKSTGASGGATLKRPPADAQMPFPAKVYFLSNGSCGSSCLNFADMVLFIPGVSLIGSATSGDGMLMDVRTETLPSGLARVVIPQKVARGRGRGHLEVYLPDVAYTGRWDDAAVREWVMSLVDAPARRTLK
jgi:hypothetical protein